MPSKETPAAHAALSGLIDYAGLFPPAALSMPDAFAGYRSATELPQSWMLGRFVVPLSRLMELQGSPTRLPIAVNAILDARPDPLQWFAAAVTLLETTQEARADGRTRIEAIEAPLPPLVSAREAYGSSIGQLAALMARHDLGALPIYVELPRDARWTAALGEAMDSMARHGLRAKVRCGGTAAAAFPSCEELAAFIIAATRAGVPFRATAGLHHPVRHFDATVGYQMHGFLNLLAATLIAIHDDDVAAVVATLGEEDASAFVFDDAGFRIRGRYFDLAAIENVRRVGFVAYGSCSFDEPVADLTAMGVLPPTVAR